MKVHLAFVLGFLTGTPALWLMLPDRTLHCAATYTAPPGAVVRAPGTARLVANDALADSVSAPVPPPLPPLPPPDLDAQVRAPVDAPPSMPVSPLPPGASLGMPISGVDPAQLRDDFGDARGAARGHEAIDIAAPVGTPVLAVDDGTLVKLFTSVRGGLTVYQFDVAGEIAYYYAHLDGYAPGLVEGQTLARGDLIGYVGYSGNANPLAPHLHFAVFELGPEKFWWKGKAINPYPLLGGRAKQ